MQIWQGLTNELRLLYAKFTTVYSVIVQHDWTEIEFVEQKRHNFFHSYLFLKAVLFVTAGHILIYYLLHEDLALKSVDIPYMTSYLQTLNYP